MKKIIYTLVSSSLYMFPLVMNAQSGTGIANSDGTNSGFGNLLRNIIDFTNNTLIPFIIGIGFLVFVWGMFQYFIAGGANDEKKEKGRSLMIYATLGFVLIIVFWGVINLISTSTGLENNSLNNAPTVNTIP